MDDLDALHIRLFAVDLADALKVALLTNDYRDLDTLIEGWEATAKVIAPPVAEIMRPKQHRPLSDFG